MKLTAILSLSCLLAVSAFGVSPDTKLTKKALTVKPSAFAGSSAVTSTLFRDPTIVRGGAVPGWAAYNDALDKKPLITKAMTSLVGWALGDLLAQVRMSCVCNPSIFLLVFAPKNDFGISYFLVAFFIDFHHWRSIRHEALHYSFSLWFHLPWSFWPLFLQLARQTDCWH
jgi:hypothetical protein